MILLALAKGCAQSAQERSVTGVHFQLIMSGEPEVLIRKFDPPATVTAVSTILKTGHGETMIFTEAESLKHCCLSEPITVYTVVKDGVATGLFILVLFNPSVGDQV